MDSGNNASFSIDALLGAQQQVDGTARKTTRDVHPSLSPPSVGMKNSTSGEIYFFRKRLLNIKIVLNPYCVPE